MFANMNLKNTVLIAGSICLAPLSVSAQIVIDGSTSTTVTTNGNVITINGDDRAGGNLFHSFQDFSVPSGSNAFFNNAIDVSNIFSRVTGGNISNIDGFISANGSANLFLINPAGILFGDGASLNIGGSFYGSTADSIVFSDGEFSATDLNNPPLLTINAPIGLNFRDNPAEIQIRGADLRVSPGQTLALLGGNVSFEDTQTFPVGVDLELGGLSSSGTISFDDNFNLSFPENVNLADVSLSGSTIFINSDDGGSIKINAANLALSEGSQLLAGIRANSTNFNNAQAGDIAINVTDTISLTGSSGIDNNIQPNSLGNAGDILLTATNISLSGNSRLNSLTASGAEGNTGNLILEATNSISLEDSIISTQIQEGATGNAGNIEITANSLSINSSVTSLEAPITSRILNNTLGNGDAGNITITTESILLDKGGIASQVTSGDNTIAQGNAGIITIDTGSATFQNRSEILSDTNGIGNAGDINIIARENIVLDGNTLIASQIRPDSQGNAGNIEITAGETFSSSNFSFVSTNVQEGGIGQGGELRIEAQDVVLTNGAILDALTENNVAGSNNDGGSITVEAQTLELTAGGKIITGTDGNGNAGDINLQISDRIEIDGENAPANEFIPFEEPLLNALEQETGLFANTTIDSSGNGGSISIESQNLEITAGGKIVAATDSNGNAGDINLQISESITIDGENVSELPPEILEFDEQVLNELEPGTGLFANTTDGSRGNGGSINIQNPISFIIINGGQVTVDSQGSGNGGNLFIQTNSLTLENQAELLAATQFGQEDQDLSTITLQIEDTLLLKGDSQISAQAFNDANGGNININAQFVIAFAPQIEGNDIIANASEGNGGDITITATEILGLQERSAISENGTNDIDASSEFGFDGDVSLNTPDIGGAKGLVQFSPNIVRVNEDFASVCGATRVAEGSSFTIKGRGGIPPQPIEIFTAEGIILNNGSSRTSQSRNKADLTIALQQQYPPIMTSQGEVYPARGLVIGENGKISLTRYPTTYTQRALELSQNCSKH
ncbi:MAG: filamentous hemagglutinin N-terminal domain-containing protein [Cyanobacteria bacterium P01_F01_bin.143]